MQSGKSGFDFRNGLRVIRLEGGEFWTFQLWNCGWSKLIALLGLLTVAESIESPRMVHLSINGEVSQASVRFHRADATYTGDCTGVTLGV